MSNWSIDSLNSAAQSKVQQRIDNKTKPVGALGQLETLALQLALIQQTPTLEINRPTVLVFAGDHGVSEEGISIAPSEVTAQMVMNFLQGGAAINCFCRSNDLKFEVIDAGIKHAITPHPEGLVNQSVANGTNNLSKQAAMSSQQLNTCFEFGGNIVNKHIDSGSNVIAFGEMGIGNTTSAAAILSAVTGLDVEQCVGRGTGITDEQFTRKTALIKQALTRFDKRDALTILTEVGGFEIAQICGAMLKAAERKITIVVDGFIVGAAALLATQLAPQAKDYMVFAHCSHESGHQLMLEYMQAKPLLNLGLRLGEGTGAALAIPLLRSTACFYNEMATFDSAGVTV
jgi:nicotinate-nucleotide--dimethylbenzimidazole phosphoribosyltransferase